MCCGKKLFALGMPLDSECSSCNCSFGSTLFFCVFFLSAACIRCQELTVGIPLQEGYKYSMVWSNPTV